MMRSKGDDDVHEHEEDTIVTLEDYLQLERQLEQQAAEALPGRFDECTYPRGPLRQAIYVCSTCAVVDGDQRLPNAICYACSVSCHYACELVELSTRRWLRCDCGNSRLTSILVRWPQDHLYTVAPCSLFPSKEATNVENQYGGRGGHNFQGRFCLCNVPYDAEAEQSDMLQCLICQDWYHEDCISPGAFPPPEAFDEIICKGCVRDYPFLSGLQSSDRVFSLELHQREASAAVEILAPAAEEPPSKISRSSSCFSCEPSGPAADATWLFLREGWRESLCNCAGCRGLLESHTLAFIATEEPTYQPEPDPEAGSPSYDYFVVGTRLLDRLVGRDVAITGIRAVDQLRERLMEFLRPFATAGKVVTKEDIHDFFASVTTNKSP